MKKIAIFLFSTLFTGSVIFISCKSKNDSGAITPGYKEELGTGSNPNITQVTTTGTVATTSVANQNSSITGIGQSGGTWSSVNCSTPAPTCLSISNSSLGTSVSICFLTSPTAGTYNLIPNNANLTATSAVLRIDNPPSQPLSTSWYSSTGTVVVTIVGSSIKATFSNIACTQSTTGSGFPIVTASGEVGCL